MSGMFGGRRDPFDDPFFRRPLGSLFGSSMFGSMRRASSGDSSGGFGGRSTRGPVIEELDPDDECLKEENGVDHAQEEGSEGNSSVKKSAKAREKTWINSDPLVEHPEDQTDGDYSKSERKSKELAQRTNHNDKKGKQTQSESVSYRRVTYGGLNGAYYTATTTCRTGSDGTILQESRQMDRTTGEAAHRISKGINDKGHTVTRMLNSDGKVDTMQMLHNLEEDELAAFEKNWKGNADQHLSGWDKDFSNYANTGLVPNSNTSPDWGSWPLVFRDPFRRDAGSSLERHRVGQSSTDKPRKVVTINIE